MSDTPETDNHSRVYQTAGMPRAYSILLDLSRKLERERDEARAINEERADFILKLQIKHNAERDQLRKVVDALYLHPDSDYSHEAYNSLPHVIERNKSK